MNTIKAVGRLFTAATKAHPKAEKPDSRQVRRQKERLASKPSLVNPKVLGRER